MASRAEKRKGVVAAAEDKIADIEIPKVSLTNVRVKEVKRRTLTITGLLSFTNPLAQSIQISRIHHTIKSNGKVLDSGIFLYPAMIPFPVEPKGKIELVIPAIVTFDLMVKTLTAAKGRYTDLDYEMEVKVTICGSLSKILSTKGEDKLPSPLDMLALPY